ncbi:MAG: RnfABCDGE type electron transport complex subunit B [Alphaproteobacteria bacterium]|nr:RnfABCDGE type electron transport complex subunit B [Alphaproteobacteria bacterium]
MLLAIGSVAVMGAALGGLLGVAAKLLAVEENPLEVELLGMLPGAQCGQCGYVGCGQYAAALAKGEALITACAPGGKPVIEALAKKLGVTPDMDDHEEQVQQYAVVDESLCIGCMRCLGECSVDAIVGAAKQMHTVIKQECHGCKKCFDICPTEAIKMVSVPVTLSSWHWHKPDDATAVH